LDGTAVIGFFPRFIAALVTVLAIGVGLAKAWPAKAAEPVPPPIVVDAGPPRLCATATKPAICRKRFHSAGELCSHVCAPLDTGDGWLVSLACVADPPPEPWRDVQPIIETGGPIPPSPPVKPGPKPAECSRPWKRFGGEKCGAACSPTAWGDWHVSLECDPIAGDPEPDAKVLP